MVESVSETIKVSKQTKESLLRVAAKLQAKEGRRIDFDEAISHLISLQQKRPDILEGFFRSAPGLTADELHRERREDERRAKRKFGL